MDSRSVDDNASVRRRRECLDCGRRFTTYERIEESAIWVRKRSGEREAFSPEKVVAGVLMAAKNRPIDVDQASSLARRIEEEARSMDHEVSSDWVGAEVLRGLEELDPVSYLRFASVYRDHGDIEDFTEELRRLLDRADSVRESET
ncbi:MAG: transcriptional regulator NrdR [Acidimicrobiales bacterium]